MKDPIDNSCARATKLRRCARQADLLSIFDGGRFSRLQRPPLTDTLWLQTTSSVSPPLFDAICVLVPQYADSLSR